MVAGFLPAFTLSVNTGQLEAIQSHLPFDAGEPPDENPLFTATSIRPAPDVPFRAKPCRTPIRHAGQHSAAAAKSSAIPSERCPASLRNAVRHQPGILSVMARNARREPSPICLPLSSPRIAAASWLLATLDRVTTAVRIVCLATSLALRCSVCVIRARFEGTFDVIDGGR